VRRLADEVRASVNDAMKTLRADLAAAAQEARVESGPRQGPDNADWRTESRRVLHEAETALHEFRSELRAELRMQVAHGVLEREVLDVLTEGLRSVRRDVIAALRS
jgi:hypothetical protein